VHRYRAYGLSFDSDVKIPELSGAANGDAPNAPDLRVRLASRFQVRLRPRKIVSTRTFEAGRPWLSCWRLRDGYLLRFFRIADFRISADGREIACIRHAARTSLNTIRHLLLDQVFPMVLNLRGREAIHATAVIVAGAAAAFLGPAGAGKSTLAASFMLAGCRALGDDCLALDAGARIRAIPAYPGFRLWTDSAEALNADASGAIPVADYTAKVRMLARQCADGFPRRPVPLSALYRLMRVRKHRGLAPKAPLIERLKPRDAMMELVGSSFPLDIADSAMLARHFQVMQRVAREVPFSRVMVPDDFGALPSVRDAILSDLGAH